MPQCVLTLSLIALSFDIYDGQQNLKSKQNPNRNNDKKNIITNEDTAIERIPTFIEILSKCYFPPIFLIGPQIKFKDYIIFIESNESILKSWLVSIILSDKFLIKKSKPNLAGNLPFYVFYPVLFIFQFIKSAVYIGQPDIYYPMIL